jgi:predicted metalloprotease with PDZ domain
MAQPDNSMRRTSFKLVLFFVTLFASSSIARGASPVTYKIRIDPKDLSGYDVEMQFITSSRNVRVAMAAHPEYDDRYWRYIENFTAESRGRTIPVNKPEDAVWQINGAAGELIIRYRLHLPTQNQPVRDAWKPFLTANGGMVGDLHSLMYLVGGESRRAKLTLEMPADWKAASGLEPTKDRRTFTGSTELMLDSPVLIGTVREWKFSVAGIPHTMAIWSPPNAKPYDAGPLLDGIKRLGQQAVKAFGRPPYPRYTFLFQSGGQAALEHLTSVNLGLSSDLNDLFDELAHEYIHVWNLMDVRPRERVGLKYRFAEPTGVLWWNEGATIMFADLLLRRAALGDRRSRVQRLESIIARYLTSPGYSTLSADLVSRGDSYPLLLGDNRASTHLQGEVLTTMLDLRIRDATNGRLDVTHVMKLLAARFDSQHGITNADIERAIVEVCRCEMKSFFRDYIYGAKLVDFDRYLGLIAMRADVTRSPALNPNGKPAVDLRIGPLSPEGEVILRITNPQSSWGKTGLHTGDRLLSVDDTRVSTWSDFRDWLRKLKVGDVGRLVVVSNGVTKTVEVPIKPYDVPTVHLVDLPNVTAKQLALRQAWMNAN